MRRFPEYPKGITVPTLVDIESKWAVTNDFPTMVRDFATEWGEFHRPGAPDLYPESLREEIDAIADRIFPTINIGVYQCGLTREQDVHDEGLEALFGTLDELEERLADRRFLLGDRITLADVNLFVTLIRFDVVYHGLFKCNRYKISEKPSLWGYLRDLFQTPGFGDTTNFQQIKDHYYKVITDVNPAGVVAAGPDPAGLYTPHHRERLGGSPFGNGTPPAAPQDADVLTGDERGAFA